MSDESYSGRLAFDSDSGFHLAEDGRPVVTEDAGKTWRYAREGDTSHNMRYLTRVKIVESTANDVARHLMQGGTEEMARALWPHHYDVHPDDPHAGGLRFHPDSVAATVTSHTEAYA